VITCKSAAEARAAVDAARRILKQLGVELHPQKTRIVHVRYGFEFLGYKIKRGYKKLHLPESLLLGIRIQRILSGRFVVSWTGPAANQTDDAFANQGAD
jgi:hypothetical protein